MPVLLQAMPATTSHENRETMKFYLWLAEKTRWQPALEFAAVLVRLMAMQESSMGFFKGDKLATIMKQHALRMIVDLGPRAKEFCTL